jgi:type III pantothenate kinase
MILAVDVGNTETVIGLLRGLETVRCWRIATDRRRTGDELALQVSGFMSGLEAEGGSSDVEAGEPSPPGSAERAILASVVPVLDRAWAQACHAVGLEPRFVNGGSPLPIRLDVDAPLEVGADRIANTLAASELFERDTIVVDLGTATTFDCIGAEGVFFGGVIAPGPRAGIERLTTVATQLPQVEIHPPARVIGRRTVDCVDSGVFYATVDAIDGIVHRIVTEWERTDPLVVATGGLADVIAPHCRTVERVEPFLTITGLAIADRYLGEVR